MPHQFPVFELLLKKRGRVWRWCVCTTEGQVVMHGAESSRPAAKYKADRALFLMLLGALAGALLLSRGVRWAIGGAALIALGAVIRGQTPHFDYVAGECAGGIARIALETGVPIAFGVLTTDTVEQAVDRAGGKAGNKGADAALVAIEMANLLRRLDP